MGQDKIVECRCDWFEAGRDKREAGLLWGSGLDTLRHCGLSSLVESWLGTVCNAWLQAVQWLTLKNLLEVKT
jgi:hypothetical protein